METPAQLHIKNSRGKKVGTVCCCTANIGAGGAYFKTSSCLEGNTRVTVELALGADKGGSVLVKNRVSGCGVLVSGTVLRSGSEGIAVGFDEAYRIVSLPAMEEVQSSSFCQAIGEQGNVTQTSHSRKGGEEGIKHVGKSEVDNQTNLSYGGVKMKKVMQFLRDEEGATAIEYGIMVALISAILVLTVQSIGVKVQTAFSTVDGALP